MPVVLGLLGVLGFSFTLPATRVAVDGLDPVFVGLGRAAVAALPAAALLLFWGERLPDRRTLGRLALVALGVVFGFPLLSAFALRELTAAMRRFDGFVRELARFNERLGGSTHGHAAHRPARHPR